MASNLNFVEYVCNQILNSGNITYKKMFGEYSIYCNAKVIGLICENQFFIKKTIAGAELLNGVEEASPYKGAKPYFIIENLEDREFLEQLVYKTYEELPMPKPKKKK